MKQTIEQLLKATIAGDIQAHLVTEASGYTLSTVNDLRFNTEADTIKVIQACIKTGNGTRSNVPDFEAGQSAVTIIFQLDANYLQRFLQVLNDYCSQSTAQPGTVIDTRDDEPTEDDITYKYRLEWGAAITSGTPQDVQFAAEAGTGLQYETGAVEQVILTGTVYYSTNFIQDDETVFVKISATFQEIKGIGSYHKKLTPVYQSIPVQGQLEPVLALTGYNEVYSMTFSRIPGNAVHELFLKKFHSAKTATTFNLEAKFVITSLAISDECDVLITDIDVDAQPTYQLITIGLMRV